MNSSSLRAAAIALIVHAFMAPCAGGYTFDSIVPASGGCPQPGHRNLASGASINRRWSTSLPATQSILTTAAQGTPAQLDEMETTIKQAFDAWTGVSGTLLSIGTLANGLAPLVRTSAQNACGNDQGTNADGLNTICFNQSSAAFAFGVLAFTRTLTADGPGVSVGAGAPSAFAGEILDADVQFRNDGQEKFATPGALAAAPGAYDLESLLAHELGHFFGLDHSAVWRALMFPYAPPPGTFLGSRPSAQFPDAPLAEDDRTGLRVLYPDPSDTVHAGTISGRVFPANPFALAALPSPSAGGSVTGIFGAQVVALDADTGVVIAGVLGGWSCDATNLPAQFDGSFRIERLRVGRNYKIYAEPLDGLAQPTDVRNVTGGLCRADVPPACAVPAMNTNFAVRIRRPSP
jgi:hypothetical protein